MPLIDRPSKSLSLQNGNSVCLSVSLPPDSLYQKIKSDHGLPVYVNGG